MKILLSLIICSSVAGECMPPYEMALKHLELSMIA